MEFRRVKDDEINLFLTIDRQEVIEEIYYFRNGELILEKEYYNMMGFPPGEQEDILKRLYDLHHTGGIIIGAFDENRLVGITSLENKFRGSLKDQLKMDVLFVSHNYRGKGIAKRLIEMIKEEGIERGAKKIYVSATPSKNTVDFYMSVGCRLAEEVDEELFQLEPLDIHLELVL
ncbi:GNAT family N-acetyltransferase [Alkaliphilus transvaalensis]|uniref:GNAT family N-acetyltransferase n=1 Tax=Alkaliphilus transvaalensis TaxID=114628 RepID=UPI00047CACC4|nr:GNAT family N-acetyltransferase [Alkaliphilus transvaalensis]